MTTTRASLCILAVICVALSSWSQPSGNAAVLQLGNRALQSNDLVLIDSDETIIRNELTKQIQDLVTSKNFDALDKMADELRKSKAQTASGTWRLGLFYRILTFDWTDVSNVTEEMWKSRFDFLNSWVKAKPTCVTARIALARCYKNYAWNARGLGNVNKVTEEGWRLFAERLRQAMGILMETKQMEPKCPVWWDTMQYVALGQSLDLASYDKLFKEAIAFEPQYTYFYNHKVTYLLPRWLGVEGDWQKFALEAADRIGGEAGDILYARIGWRAHERRYYEAFLRDSGYSWPRMKKGLEAIVRQFPDSQSAASELALLASQKNDRTCAKPLFERLGPNMDRDVWRGDKARFLRARAWALSK